MERDVGEKNLKEREKVIRLIEDKKEQNGH